MYRVCYYISVYDKIPVFCFLFNLKRLVSCRALEAGALQAIGVHIADPLGRSILLVLRKRRNDDEG